MKFDKLEIREFAGYEGFGEAGLKGIATLKGENGTLTVKLSAPSISSILKLVKSDVAREAEKNARDVELAMENASETPMLAQTIEHEEF